MTASEMYAPGWRTPQNGERTVVTDDDGEMVARFLRGDQGVFDTLFRKYQDYVYHIVYGIVGSAEESRDLTQEVFVQVYRSLPQFRNGSRFSTWLYRIAVNRAVDAARGARKWRFFGLLDIPALANRSADTTQEPENIFVRRAEGDEIQTALMRCSLTHREVLVLRYYRDLSLEEIAETLGCSLSAAKVRLHRARIGFKDHYIRLYGADREPDSETNKAPDTATRRGADSKAELDRMAHDTEFDSAISQNALITGAENDAAPIAR